MKVNLFGEERVVSKALENVKAGNIKDQASTSINKLRNESDIRQHVERKEYLLSIKKP